MNSLLLWIGGLLCAVLGLLFAVPYVVDWNAYRGVFEEEATRILGRDVRVGGQVNLRLLPSPYVRFEKVRISDAGAALGEPFFRTESFTLWLSTAPLLKGAIEASEVEFDSPVLRLAVDQDGRGNWQALQITPGSLPFMPSDVVLQQVRIRNGIVSLRTPGIAEPLTLAGIDGELAATSLDGPYRFRGMVDWQGARRELRLGTSQREADGKLRYKASIRSTDNGIVYSLDGALSELSPRGRNTATLTAKLPLATVFGDLLQAEAAARLRKATDAIDLKGSLVSDLEGATLTDLAFAFEQNGKPQLVSGELTANWRRGLRVETRLSSRWLDLDQIVGVEGAKGPPVDTVRRIIGQVSTLLPREGTSLLTFDVDQINLGAEALSNVKLALARAGGLTSIGELSAALPGNARGELRGTLEVPAGPGTTVQGQRAAVADTFNGEVVLRGSSLQRLARWGGAGAMLAAPAGAGDVEAGDAPFSLVGRLRLAPEALSVSEARVELGSNDYSGGAAWRWAPQPSLELSADGRAIDISPFVPGSLDLTSLAGGDTGSAAKSAVSAPGFIPLQGLAERVAAIEQNVGRLALKLRAGELKDGKTVLRDVDADIEVKQGAVRVGRLRLTSASNIRLDLAGELAGLVGKPSGTLRGWTTASSETAIAALQQALPDAARPFAAHLLGNARRTDLGFAVALGGAAADAVALEASGTIDGEQAAFNLRLDGGLGRWRDAPIGVSMTAKGAVAAGAVQRLMASSAPAASTGSGFDSLTLNVRAAGASSRSIVTAGKLEARRGNAVTIAELDGRSGLVGESGVETTGELKLSTTSAADLVALVGSHSGLAIDDLPVRGRIEIAHRPGSSEFFTHELAVGGARARGTVTLARRAERVRVDGAISVDQLSIPAVLGLVLRGGKDAPASDVAITSPWPDGAFDLSLVERSEGQIIISTPTASLQPDLKLSDVEMRLAFTPGRIELQSLAGMALGGRFTARGTIEGAPSGANVALDARLTGGKLESFAEGGGVAGQRTSGETNAVLSLSGRATSPRALMTAASGRGEIEIRNGRVGGIGSEIVERAVLAAIESSEGVDRAGLERLIGEQRQRSQTVLGNRKLAIAIADGAARVAPLEIARPEASLRNVTTIDLVELKADSEWQIIPRKPLETPGRAAAAHQEPLPPLSIVWTGSLGSLHRAEPRLSVDQLERELQIRRMERDAARLEHLRREDEERARLEQQRRMETPMTAPTAGQAANAPVIEAPLPISPGAAPGGSTQVAPVQSRPARPPAQRRPREAGKSLQDLLMGNQ